MKNALTYIGFTLTIFSFLPLLRTPLWWIRIFDFPRAHIALLLTATLFTYVFRYGVETTEDILMLVAWGAGILNEVRYIFSFTPLTKVEALRTARQEVVNSLDLMIANVRMTNKKYQKFLDLVLKVNPDMLVINEPNEAWHQYLRKELDVRYPYAIKKPLENTYGMILYSKYKLLDSEINFLVEDEIPSFHTIVEMPSGAKFELFTVHPQPPRLMRNTETREAELLLVAKLSKKKHYPTIVAGDLNDVAWSSTTKLFKNISGLLDPRVGRGFFNTYNANIPLFRYPLDHVFYDPSFRLVGLQRLDKFGSDHFPILISLSYEPLEQDEQEQPVADLEDHQEANELIQEGLEKGAELNEEKRQNGRAQA